MRMRCIVARHDLTPTSLAFTASERYGAAGAARVAALEAAQQARYERELSAGGRVLLWPCEPLRSFG